MTIPQIFESEWERSGGDMEKAITAMRARIEAPGGLKVFLTAGEIVSRVALHHGITVQQIKYGGRSLVFARPRQEAMWLLRRCTPLSLPGIGRCLGGKDHSTVIHGIKAMWRRCAELPGYQEMVESVVNGLGLPMATARAA